MGRGSTSEGRVMSITRTQVFFANISNLWPGEGLGLGVGEG